MRLTQGAFSFLPDLTDDQIRAQVEYCLGKGWAVSVEYTDDPHPRNVYWEMWVMPMFDLKDAAGVMDEINACPRSSPPARSASQRTPEAGAVCVTSRNFSEATALSRVTTEKRDLRSGVSVWDPAAFPAKQLKNDIKADVLVIGAGVTGSLIAEALSQHFSVAVVDRRGAASGSTVASTGLLLFEIDTPLILLREKIGRERADRAWRRSDSAMRALVSRVQALEIDCGLASRTSVYLPGTTLDADGLREEAEARAQCGLTSQWIGGAELQYRFGVTREAAILSGNTAEVHPVKFSLGFLHRAVARGTQVYTDVDVTGLDIVAGGVHAATSGGARIEAGAVVFATGYEIPNYINLNSHEVASTWAIATVPQELRSWPQDALFWEASDSYSYARATPDGRVLVGGGDEDFDDEERRKELTPEKSQFLRRRLREILPDIDTTIEFAWSGAFGTTPSGLPSIGSIPGMPNCYAVLGFGGNGMTYAMIGAQLLESRLRGIKDPDEDLFEIATAEAREE